MNKKAIEFLSNNDEVLREIISQIELPVIESTGSVFHDLISCILEQQIHYRSTKRIFQKMLERASIQILEPGNFGDFEERSISSVKFSLRKLETVVGIVEFWEENQVDWKLLDDEEVCTKLSNIKGVGRWSIDMILLYTLERPNVFPIDDFHLKQVMTHLYKLNPKTRLKAQMIEVSNGWGEHKSLAVKYLLAWKKIVKFQNKYQV